MATEHPIRVFVSYSHNDLQVAERLTDSLKKHGLIPDWDHNIQPGTPFTDDIRSRILHSHVCMPLLTNNSHHGLWIHQEIGYAMALNIPILPIVIGDIKDMTQAMSAQLQAIIIPDVGELEVKLTNPPIAQTIRRLVEPRPFVPKNLIEVAYWPEVRTELLAKYAQTALEMYRHCLRNDHSASSSGLTRAVTTT